MRTIKIALSASFWNVPACKALLMLCDRIYTSNAGAYGELQEVFGADRIKVMPDAMPSTLQWVKQREIEMEPDANVSFVTYSDLHKISTCYDARMEEKDKEIAMLKAELAAVLKTDLPVLLDADEKEEHIRSLEDAVVAKEREITQLLKSNTELEANKEYKRLFEDRDACLTQRNNWVAELTNANEVLVERVEERDAWLVNRDRTIEILLRDSRQMKDALAIRDGRLETAEKITELRVDQHDRDLMRVRDLEAAVEAKDREIDRLTSMADQLVDVKEPSTLAEDQDRIINHLNDTLQARDARINVLVCANKLLVEDQRRLNYLIKLGEYWPPEHNSPAFNVWTLTSAAGVPFRVHLDKLREGLEYDKDNVPISPHGGPAWAAAHAGEVTNWSLEPNTMKPGEPDPFHLDERISGGGPMPRDPMDQDHSV